MVRYQNVVIDTNGNAIPTVTVSVYDKGTTNLSVIYSDNGITPKSNPFSSSSDGGFTFYAANGRYDIALTKTGYTFGTDLYDIQLFDATGASVAFAAPVGVTGTLSATTDVSGATATISGNITSTTGKLLLGTIQILRGTATPESAVTAPVGSIFLRTDGAADTTLYVKETGTGNTGWVAVQLFTNKIKTGNFTLAAAATTDVTNAAVAANSKVFIVPTNAAAGALMAGAKSLYHSANTAGVSFTVATADASAAAGTETFNYILYV